jgi:nucleotide-binding universal stress UspA family protein
MNNEENENKTYSDNSSKTIIIACYRRPYVKSSLESIDTLLKKEKTEKVYILSISEEKKPSATVENYLGSKDVKEFESKLDEDQTYRASKYTDEILRICEELEINCKKIEKKGNVSEIILEEAKKHKPSHIVIHRSDKTRIDKRLSGSVSDEVCKESMCIVTILR